METLKYGFVLEATQPIAHHSESLGNMSIAMRRKTRQPDGSFTNVPVITGDTMRHGMREASTYAFLDAAGLLENVNLSEAALRLLFAGGMITGSSGGAVKLGDYREMVDLVPPLALFGGCAQNRVIPGRLIVEDAVLVCSESWHLIPDWVHQWMAESMGGEARVESCRGHVEEAMRVRMDPTLDPGKRQLLSSGAASDVMLSQLLSEKAGEMKDVEVKNKEKSSMMPRSFERIVAGSLFYWSTQATCYSDLDKDVFLTTCATYLSSPRAGGKRGTGHGLLRPVKGYQVGVSSPVDRLEVLEAPDKLGPRIGHIFREHVTERSEEIAEFLAEVKA